jgi:hypothetical protein
MGSKCVRREPIHAGQQQQQRGVLQPARISPLHLMKNTWSVAERRTGEHTIVATALNFTCNGQICSKKDDGLRAASEQVRGLVTPILRHD